MKAAVKEASHGFNEPIDLLIKVGADVNAADQYGNTAMMEAAYAGNIPCVRTLLKSGAYVNNYNNGGFNATNVLLNIKITTENY